MMPTPNPSSPSQFAINDINRVRQAAPRGHYDHETIHAILDACLVGNVAFATKEVPFVVPMLFARKNDELLFHGSAKSRLMNLLCSHQTVCVSATQVDGLVLAKSLFRHSMNYRSVSVFGIGRELTDDNERIEALQLISEKAMPGRWSDARGPTENEMRATCIAAVNIETASAKIRSGPPRDDQADLELPHWSGIVPMSAITGPPVTTHLDKARSIPVPNYVRRWQTEFNRPKDQLVRPDIANKSVGRFHARETRLHSIETIRDRKLKIYTIKSREKKVDDSVIGAALDLIQNQLEMPLNDSGYGFVTIHFGDSIWLLVDLWQDDILCHFLFRSDYDNPTHFQDGPDDGTAACVWELEVIKHERDAWVRHVMSREEADFENYLADDLVIHV